MILIIVAISLSIAVCTLSYCVLYLIRENRTLRATITAGMERESQYASEVAYYKRELELSNKTIEMVIHNAHINDEDHVLVEELVEVIDKD